MAKKNNEYRMAIKIAGEIEKSLYNSTDLTRKELNKIAREAARASSRSKGEFEGLGDLIAREAANAAMQSKESLYDIGKGIEQTGPLFDGIGKAGTEAFQAVAAAAAAAGAAIIGIGTASANAGIDFESAFTGVKKTTEATEQEYAQMKQEILAMTREIPAAGTEVAAVAEAAGQLGIGRDSLLSFTRVMIDLGEATNLTSEEAASALAKFANITGMDAGDYDRLGSVIVGLGNNFATTESDIVSMATRMASAGELAGFTEPQIMAMATAMSSVGIEAEAGGSSMSKVIKKIQVAVETGGKSLSDYASVAGVSVEKFKEDFQRDALSAVAAFIGGLNDVERNGKSATVILDDMGLTEVNLSNTLLSLANANGMMSEAVETANRAWEENTALSNEASMRYETTESKLAIMRNGFTEMGVVVYDQFNGPLREGIDVVTDLVHSATAKISGSNVIHDLAQDIVENIPTAVRVTGDLAEAVGDLAGPFLSIGGWLVKHPKALTSSIAGVGAALGGYKIASGINAVASALGALGPAAMPVIGAAGGIAAVAGVGTYFYQLDQEMTRNGLAERFGDIALSMEEVNEAARAIVGEQHLGQLEQILSANASSGRILDSLEESIREINAQRWEISVGLSFSAEDKEEYAQAAQQYISDVQDYISSEGYAFQLSAEMLLSGSVQMDEIIADNNSFYSQLGAEMRGIGDEVNTIITKALEEGLEIDQEEIDGLLEDAQRIQEALAGGESKAKLATLEAKYSGADLDSESMQNLMQEINNYVEESNEQVWEGYNNSIARLEARKELDGDYTQEEYEADKEAFLQGAYNRRAENILNAQDFLLNTIEELYGDDISPYREEVEGILHEEMERMMNSDGIRNTYSTPEDWAGQAGSAVTYARDKAAAGLGRDGKEIDLLAGYLRELEAQADMLKQQAESSGGAIDEEIRGKLDQAGNKAMQLGALGGNEDDMWAWLGNVAGENADYSAVLLAAGSRGAAIPQAAIDAMAEKQPEAEKAVQDMFDAMEEKLGQGIDATVPVSITYKEVANFRRTGKIGGYAGGGIVDQPQVAWVAEGGYPESIIPIDGSQRAINLWERTGELLGVSSRGGSFSSLAGKITGGTGSSGNWVPDIQSNSTEDNKFVFAPVISAGGSSLDEERLRSVMSGMFDEFEDRIREVMEKRERDRERFSFS